MNIAISFQTRSGAKFVLSDIKRDTEEDGKSTFRCFYSYEDGATGFDFLGFKKELLQNRGVDSRSIMYTDIDIDSIKSGEKQFKDFKDAIKNISSIQIPTRDTH